MISALGSFQGWQEIEVTVDSGACDTVMPLSLCSEITLRESAQQRSGLEYEVANGQSIPNEGERRCLMMTRGANGPKRITFQVAEVHKALLSITRAADAGFECHLNAKGGYLLDTWTGEKVQITRKGNLYVMRTWVKEDSGSDVRRESEPAKHGQGFCEAGLNPVTSTGHHPWKENWSEDHVRPGNDDSTATENETRPGISGEARRKEKKGGETGYGGDVGTHFDEGRDGGRRTQGERESQGGR